MSDIDAHGFNLHPLKGNRQSEWAIWVSGNWRITFRFDMQEAVDIWDALQANGLEYDQLKPVRERAA